MILSLTILALSGALLLSSAFDYFFNFAAIENFILIRSYVGKFVVGISIVFAVLNMRFTSHPMYENWISIMAGGVIGIIYSFH